MSPILEIRNLCLSKGNRTVLSEISMDLFPDRIHILMGKNGAGKTTLLRCLTGHEKYRGNIWMDGRELREFSSVQRACRIACLPQVLPEIRLTVRELVRLGRNPYVNSIGHFTAEDEAIVESAMRDTQILSFAERSVNTLSGGERQRAWLAMVLCQNTEILLLDEPTASLDVDARKEMWNLIRSLLPGHAFLVVLHDFSEAVTFAQDITILQSNSVLFSGEKEQCLSEGWIEKAFSVKRFEFTEAGTRHLFFQ